MSKTLPHGHDNLARFMSLRPGDPFRPSNRTKRPKRTQPNRSNQTKPNRTKSIPAG